MDLLPFGQLPVYAARRFVPVGIDLGDWKQIAPLFDQLEASIPTLTAPEQLEDWLLKWSELNAALDEEGTRRYIAMTCHTENSDAEKSYLQFVEQVEPETKPRQFKLEQLYLQHPVRSKLPSDRYRVFDRNTQVRVELFREQNVPLETEEARLGQQFQKLSGSLTVKFQGEEKTLVQMARYLEEPDRSVRQETWELVANRRLMEADRFEEIFEQMLRLREQIAHNAGFANYREYAFRLRGRFDYTADDCLNFHQAVKTEIMPVLSELQIERRGQLGVDSLRPWDLAVDPLNRPALRPFENVEILKERTQKIFDRLDAELSSEFGQMQSLRLLDLDNRKGKAPGGYQAGLAESRLPFIFMNAVGVQRDVETILHEAGHAFHALATQGEDLYAYRSAPIEFCEVASMSMELLGNEFIESFYPAPEAKRARHDHLEGIIEFFPWMATIDAFQHWIYTHPGHTRTQRTQAWLELMDRFGGEVDWSGYEAAKANLWHRQLHIFLHPFYYVEYGIAQLGALQVWANSKIDPVKAIQSYKRGLKLGGSRPLPELFSAAGCRFDFSSMTIRPLVQALRGDLMKLK